MAIEQKTIQKIRRCLVEILRQKSDTSLFRWQQPTTALQQYLTLLLLLFRGRLWDKPSVYLTFSAFINIPIVYITWDIENRELCSTRKGNIMTWKGRKGLTGAQIAAVPLQPQCFMAKVAPKKFFSPSFRSSGSNGCCSEIDTILPDSLEPELLLLQKEVPMMCNTTGGVGVIHIFKHLCIYFTCNLYSRHTLNA